MNKIKQTARALLEGILEPNEIELIDATENDEYIQLTVKVIPEAIGKIIGKEGKMVKAIRTLLKIVAYKESGKKLAVDIVKP